MSTHNVSTKLISHLLARLYVSLDWGVWLPLHTQIVIYTQLLDEISASVHRLIIWTMTVICVDKTSFNTWCFANKHNKANIIKCKENFSNDWLITTADNMWMQMPGAVNPQFSLTWNYSCQKRNNRQIDTNLINSRSKDMYVTVVKSNGFGWSLWSHSCITKCHFSKPKPSKILLPQNSMLWYTTHCKYVNSAIMPCQ